MELKEAFEVLKQKGEVEYKGIRIKAYYPELTTIDDFKNKVELLGGEE